MKLILIVTILALVALTVYVVRLARKVDAIEWDVAAIDDDAEDAFGVVGEHIGKLTARADRFEIQLGGAANNIQAQAQGADVFVILDEAQAWAAANEPVPVVPGFVGFPQDYDPSYHFPDKQIELKAVKFDGGTLPDNWNQ